MPIDMGSISALSASLQSAVEIAKALIGLREAAAIQGKVIELQGVIMSAQASALTAQADQFTLLNRVRQLEEQMAQLEDWNAERQRYELQAVYPGAFAYVLKPEGQRAEPPHWLCAACFHNHKKFVLQNVGRAPSDPHSRTWKCPKCASEVKVSWRVGPDRPYVAAAQPEPPEPKENW